VLAVRPSSRSSRGELVALAKAQPGKLPYGHAGVGTVAASGADVQIHGMSISQSVPYRGTTAVDARPARQPHRDVVRQHRERAAAGKEKKNCARWPSLDPKRSMLAPDLPTMAESGSPASRPCRVRLLAPELVHKGVIDRLHGETVKALAMPECARSSTLGLERSAIRRRRLRRHQKETPNGQN